MARNPTSLADRVEMYVEHQDVKSSLIAVSTTATTSLISSDITNTVQKGAAFYVTVSSLTATACTIGINVNGKDTVTGLYYPVGRVSLDAVSTNGNYTAIIYPGIGTTGLPANAYAANGILPAVCQVQTSITLFATTSQSNSLGLRVDMCKIL